MKKIISFLLIISMLSGMVLFLNSCGPNQTDLNDYTIVEKWIHTKISSRGSDFDMEYYIHLFSDGSYERGYNGLVDEVGVCEKTDEAIYLTPRGGTYRVILYYNDDKTEIETGNQTYYKQ